MPFDLFQRDSPYTLIRQDGFTVSLAQALRTKRYVLLFIAGQWWAPCRGVTAQLKAFYTKFHDAHNFEVVFLSTDKSEGAMLDFFHDAHGDWLCLTYKDARKLEAELAGDADLHPNQVPACLVFELEEGALRPSSGSISGEDGMRNTEPELNGTPVSKLTVAPTTPPQSVARLVTKQGREMLPRDKEGALFPWYDDGWKSPSTLTPATSLAATAVVAVDSIAKTKHVDVVPHSNSPPHASSSSSLLAATPSTQPILEHQPTTVSQVASHAGAPAKEESVDETDGMAEKAVTTPTAAQEPDAELVAHHEKTTPVSCRELTYSKSPSSADKVQPKPSPSRVLIVEKKVVVATQAAKVNHEKEGEEEAQETNRQADVEKQEILETHTSAMMEEDVSSETSAESGEEEDRQSADASATSLAEDVDELSVVEKVVPETAPPARAEGKDDGHDGTHDVKEENDSNPRKSTGWRSFIGL
ncbi:tryparedoxin-like protein [Leptomonas pyrrhocoris]|uniref:Tryparedoxin-like protein n=1 Tax=Leptomonas pyrrhocoris TaxID=157538 RepID=A0A0N0VEU2_LEPPY|nr:tryparedoxin-like protein [Leptomonas pyrrhocoris]XP_015657222.1 tryparedoxin-like protein [Leptomonas pyrrhocoris]KPA78782.1 tryparedoxin-like protein [Leptomonas pyrrhocoris]KPA78783.1 tryparedoxin-like protein [Leptomonas pyrrhocoris]|eukprot:XP_015657221.1 tryparedoxin-like protein [Leptomonas pyrrhocoris]